MNALAPHDREKKGQDHRPALQRPEPVAPARRRQVHPRRRRAVPAGGPEQAVRVRRGEASLWRAFAAARCPPPSSERRPLLLRPFRRWRSSRAGGASRPRRCKRSCASSSGRRARSSSSPLSLPPALSPTPSPRPEPQGRRARSFWRLLLAGPPGVRERRLGDARRGLRPLLRHAGPDEPRPAVPRGRIRVLAAGRLADRPVRPLGHPGVPPLRRSARIGEPIPACPRRRAPSLGAHTTPKDITVPSSLTPLFPAARLPLHLPPPHRLRGSRRPQSAPRPRVPLGPLPQPPRSRLPRARRAQLRPSGRVRLGHVRLVDRVRAEMGARCHPR